jgi:hypothetical protein
MQIGENTKIIKFLEALQLSNPAGMDSLHTAMDTICSEDNYVNKTKFRYIPKEKIYEIKTDGIRLYSFQDRLSDGNPCLVIATNGGKKNTPKEQNRDIKRSSQIRSEYLLAKKEGNINLNYIAIEQDHEN